MDFSSKTNLRDVLSKPVSSGVLEIITGIALALWVFGQIVFSRSFLAGQEWVVSSHVLSAFDAVAVGCLIAALASSGFDFKPAGVAALFGLLLSVIFVWSRNGDAHLVVLTLFLVATSGMDLRRLIRFGACAVVAGLVVGLCLSLVLLAGDSGFTVGDALSGELSFGHPRVVANLLLCVLLALAVSGARGSLVRKVVIFACVICAVLSLAFLRAPRVAFILVLLALCVVADERSLGAKVSWLGRREV